MTPAETPKVGDWCWHIHHDVLIEKLTEPFETRKAYIKAEKPKHEVEKRLRLMKPASKKASEARAVYDEAKDEALAVYYKASSEARAVYDKARSEAWAVYEKASSEAWAKVEALHQKECPNCPWNGRTIFP